MMKSAQGFTVLMPSIACVVGYVLCFWLLGKALVTVNLSVGYAIWAALGIVLTTVIAVVAFGELRRRSDDYVPANKGCITVHLAASQCPESALVSASFRSRIAQAHAAATARAAARPT